LASGGEMLRGVVSGTVAFLVLLCLVLLCLVLLYLVLLHLALCVSGGVVPSRIRQTLHAAAREALHVSVDATEVSELRGSL